MVAIVALDDVVMLHRRCSFFHAHSKGTSLMGELPTPERHLHWLIIPDLMRCPTSIHWAKVEY